MKRKLLAAAVLTIFTALYFSASAAAETLEYKIYIPISVGSEIFVKGSGIAPTDKVCMGKVLVLPVRTHYPSYTASAWGAEGTVCASAVNALHILISVEKGRGRTISIIPRDTIAPAAGPGASVVVASPSGRGIFGAWAPPVGSKVRLFAPDGREKTFNKPSTGDTIVIDVKRTRDNNTPYMAEIENRPGGRVILWRNSGYNVVGRVIKPVAGTGRFGGTLFQRSGYLRANHSGVLDYSTSPVGKIGGFQIIPWDHALSSKEMQGAWEMTQWLIIAPEDGRSAIGGTYPLFNKLLSPGPAQGERLWDTVSTYGSTSLMLFRVNGGAWQRTPEISGRNDSALKKVTHIRIYFPFTSL